MMKGRAKAHRASPDLPSGIGARSEAAGSSVFGYRRSVCDGVRLPQNGQEALGSGLNCSESQGPLTLLDD
jgi:hypothetical protein